MNFAVLKNLPVLFVCENNLYSVYSSLKVRQPKGRSISNMVSGIGIPTHSGDGNNVTEVYNKVYECLAEIRAGGGPRFLEFSTYRWLEHCGPYYDNNIGYRSESEFLEWKAREPIARFQDKMLNDSTITIEELQVMNDKITLEVEEAFNYAEESPMPSANSAYTDLYTNELPYIRFAPERIG